MKRWILALATVAGISGAAWAFWRPAATPAPAPAAAASTAAEEPKACCQKSPSRANLLTAKPAQP